MPKLSGAEASAFGIANEIIDRIDEIEEFVRLAETEPKLVGDGVATAAIRWSLDAIVLAMMEVDTDVREAYSSIPWEKMLAMQENVIDREFTMDEHLLSNIVEEVLPNLKAGFQEIAKDYQPSGGRRFPGSMAEQHDQANV